MGLKVEHFKDFSRKIVSVKSDTPKDYILSLIRNEGVSLLPIIDNDGTELKGYIKRKDLFFWFYDHPKKLFADLEIKDIIKTDISWVDEDSYISDVMEKLTNRPAVLIKSNGKFTRIISPRVAANALEKYSVAFREIEKLESYFKVIIERKKFSLASINKNGGRPKTINDLTFYNYISLFTEFWNQLEINDDKDYIIDLMHKCREYRNDLMHFKISVDTDRTAFLKSLNVFFKRNFKFLVDDEKYQTESPAFSKN